MKRLYLVLLLAAGGLVACLPSLAATAAPAAPPEQFLPWTAISGQATDLAAGVDGAVFALDSEGKVWLRRPGATMPWVGLPGLFKRIAAAAEKRAWAVDDSGTLYAYNGTWWKPMGDLYPIIAGDVGISSNGAAFAVTTAGGLVALTPRGPEALPDAPASLTRVAVDDRDQPWAVAGNGTVHRHDGKRWMTIEGLRARDIGAGNGGLWVVGMDGELLALGPAGELLRRIAARVAVVAPAPGGQPWIATADGRIYASNPDTTGRRSGPAAREQVFTQLLNWQRVSGRARQLAISPAGAVLALGSSGEVWQWKGRNNWGLLPGTFVRIALDLNNRPLAIDEGGRILRHQGSYWTELPGNASDMATGADGSLWSIQADGALLLWNERQRAWQAPLPPKPARRVAVAPDGKPWVINAEGAVFRFDGKEWVALPEVEAAEIAIGPEGSVFLASTDKHLWRWDAGGKRWERLNGEAVEVAVGPRGKPWIATADATIYASAFFDELPDSKVNTVSPAAAAAQAAATGVVGLPGAANLGAAQGKATEPLQYRKLTGTARDIAIGADGSVFVVTFDGGLARWSNTRNAFVAFTGQFARIAVAPGGLPWGITTKGEVFRHDGIDWKLVRNIAAQDIAIGFDGTVMVSGPQDYLYKYDAASDMFFRLPQVGNNAPPAGVRLAVDPAGKPWVITSDGFVARCTSGVCERLPIKARSLDVGPEGSVVIVDSDRILRRWNPRGETFDRIDSIADLVDLAAVGPRGKPWLLSTNSEVWASEFFTRDESRDVTTAAATSATSAASAAAGSATPPVFTFLVNMAFDAIPLPASYGNGGDPYIVRMEINPSGNPVLIYSASTFLTYNTATRQTTFEALPSVPVTFSAINTFAIGKDGTYWVTGRLSPYTVYRRQGNAWVSVPGLNDCSSSCQSPTLAVGPDGTVYGTSESGKLYRYDTVLKRFVLYNLPLPEPLGFIGIDPGSHFWAVGASGKLYEYTGNQWLVRNDSTVMPSCLDGGIKCFSIGANGSIYSFTSSIPRRLVRWNATSRVWDRINSSPEVFDPYAIGPDGRPWVLIQLPDTLYRAR